MTTLTDMLQSGAMMQLAERPDLDWPLADAGLFGRDKDQRWWWSEVWPENEFGQHTLPATRMVWSEDQWRVYYAATLIATVRPMSDAERAKHRWAEWGQAEEAWIVRTQRAEWESWALAVG